jgi:hypothetical protein
VSSPGSFSACSSSKLIPQTLRLVNHHHWTGRASHALSETDPTIIRKTFDRPLQSKTTRPIASVSAHTEAKTQTFSTGYLYLILRNHCRDMAPRQESACQESSAVPGLRRGTAVSVNSFTVVNSSSTAKDTYRSQRHSSPSTGLVGMNGYECRSDADHERSER